MSFGQNEVSKVWVADLGDGTYKNPILHADYSDPDVIRVGDDFYMTSSSFNCIPGLPVLHSRDLVNWELIDPSPLWDDDEKIVLAQGTGKINGPHQGAWITTATGEDWFIPA